MATTRGLAQRPFDLVLLDPNLPDVDVRSVAGEGATFFVEVASAAAALDDTDDPDSAPAPIA